MTTTPSTVQNSIETLLNPAPNRPAFQDGSSGSSGRALQFEKQLSAAQNRTNSDRALQRQDTAERAAQDAARRRSADARDRVDEAAGDQAADRKAADRVADQKAARQAALARTIRNKGEQGAQIEPGAEQRYHEVAEAEATDTDPVTETDAAATRTGQAGEMSALTQVLAVEAMAAQQIAQAMAGSDADAAAKVPTVTSIETTSGPDGVHARVSIEF